jgi:hypothetical protein
VLGLGLGLARLLRLPKLTVLLTGDARLPPPGEGDTDTERLWLRVRAPVLAVLLGLPVALLGDGEEVTEKEEEGKGGGGPCAAAARCAACSCARACIAALV